MIVINNQEVIVEAFKAILSINDQVIIFQMKNCKFKIKGSDLKVLSLQKAECIIKTTIKEVLFYDYI